MVGRLWAREDQARRSAPSSSRTRPSGGGALGAAEVARAQADGYTFLFGNTSTQVLLPLLMRPPPYDPLKDFTSIYILCKSPTVIVVHESVPARTLRELIAYAKANPGKLSYGSAGAGTLTNLAGELFKQLIGAPDIVHIPYKGSAPGVTDLASGHIPMMTPNIGGHAARLPPHRQGAHPGGGGADSGCGRPPTSRPRSRPGCPGWWRPTSTGLFAPAGLAPRDRRSAGGARRAKLMARGRLRQVAGRVRLRADRGIRTATRRERLVADEVKRWTPIMQTANFKME